MEAGLKKYKDQQYIIIKFFCTWSKSYYYNRAYLNGHNFSSVSPFIFESLASFPVVRLSEWKFGLGMRLTEANN